MKNKITVIFGILFLFSCKKTVTLHLQTAPPQIVIQGEVTDAPGPYRITINRSVGFYADNNFPPVSGATVNIHDDYGNGENLQETAPGVYSTNMIQGVTGRTYYLSVKIQDTFYTAQSTMPQFVNLDSVSFDYFSGFGSNQIDAVVNFQDLAGVKNYYQFVEYINGVKLARDIFILDDRLSDGRYITQTLFNDSTYLQRGDALRVDMYCIDSSVYNYFYELQQSGGTGAFNTTASPDNPASNISNGAFGYFSAHTVDTRQVLVQ